MADFENADSDQSTGLLDQVGATAGIDDLIDQRLVLLKQLDAIMHNKYAGTLEKLTAWLTASNIQRPSASAKQPVSVPPPTPASARRTLTTAWENATRPSLAAKPAPVP